MYNKKPPWQLAADQYLMPDLLPLPQIPPLLIFIMIFIKNKERPEAVSLKQPLKYHSPGSQNSGGLIRVTLRWLEKIWGAEGLPASSPCPNAH